MPVILHVLLLLPVPARAATFTVTKTADTADGVCNADCSLREAVIAANADDLPDTILVPPGTYTLSIAGTGEDAGATGDLDVTGPVTIAGAGAATTVVDGGGIDRVFHVRSDLARVVFQDLTIRGGAVSGDNSGGWGGGIYGFRSVVGAYNCVLTANSAARGGAVYLEAQGGEPYLTALQLSGSTVTANSAVTSGGGVGLFAAAARISHSTLSDNTTPGYAGALDSGSFSRVEIVASRVSDNQSTGGGGGVFAGGQAQVTLRAAVVEDNEAGGNGGGVFSDSADLAIEASTIRNNRAAVVSGGRSGGGVAASFGTLAIVDSRVSGNSVEMVGGGGGGISIYFLTAEIRGTTVDANATTLHGGGIAITFGTVTIENSTIVGNSVSSPTGDNGIRGGGGISWNRFGHSVTTLTNATVADNTSAISGEQLSCGACGDGYPITLRNSIVAGTGAFEACLGTITSEGGNLATDASCGLADPTDRESVPDVGLLALAANGGVTETRALAPASPAIGAGVVANCPADDQRGFRRDSVCDAGAFEAFAGFGGVGCGADLAGLAGQLRYVVEGIVEPQDTGDVVRCLSDLAED